ncbi:hypothetical protein UlMin_029414 [Ulmus minor]
MEVKKQRTLANETPNNRQWLLLQLPLGEAAQTFNLETAVCSHGLFAMAPNRWDPLSKTFSRPLQLTLHHDRQTSKSVMVRISQPQEQRHCLHIRVLAETGFLDPEHEQELLAQVSRMLRLSETDERIAGEFLEVYAPAGCLSIGRVFRSPTLFEDMVKCMLLCNCRWPRTLDMAQALCDLQLELQEQFPYFAPKTPAGKESKKPPAEQTKVELESCTNDIAMNSTRTTFENLSDSCEEVCEAYSVLVCDYDRIGNFPTPIELAKLDENFLAKRCKLGYRASRIVKLARGIVEGKIQLNQMEETCIDRSLCSYSKLAEQLRQIDGFGPFTCANVLMCMGFYHVIPTDSETIRHLKQVHGRKSTIQTIEKDVEKLYSKYAPFQFLAYWSELWNFYQERFGKFSEIPCSGYKLVTASNMRCKTSRQNKRKKRL